MESREHFLELYKHPQNFGILKNPTHQRTETISVCGDELTIQLIVENNTVKDAKFQGSGCSISMVSASLLANKIKAMRTKDIKKLKRQDILRLLKIMVNPSRIKCALLPLKAAQNSLK